MILSFKPQFIEPIMSGQKIHTIREDLGNRWKVGRQIEFATGVRTKQYRQFKAGLCVGIQRIEIWKFVEQADIFYDVPVKDRTSFPEELNPCVYIDGRRLTIKEELTLAFQDGFNSIDEFYAWFLPLVHESHAWLLPEINKEKIVDSENLVWVGKIIHWSNYKY